MTKKACIAKTAAHAETLSQCLDIRVFWNINYCDCCQKMDNLRWPREGDGGSKIANDDVARLRPLVMKLLKLADVGSLVSKNQGVFQHMVAKSGTDALTPARRSAIRRDLHRTLIGPIFFFKLPKSSGFDHGSLGELLLKTLLESFAVFNPRYSGCFLFYII